MAEFNRPYVDRVLNRLERIKPDAEPLWGEMNRAQLIGHLNEVLLYSMGESKVRFKDRSNWMSRNIIKPLIINGIVPIPHNVKLPRPEGYKHYDEEDLPSPPEATLEEFSDTISAFLNRLETRKLHSQIHPFFGRMNRKEWAKFHMAHFKHHLKQFGVEKGL